MKSRVRRESHARFCGKLRVKFPGLTRLADILPMTSEKKERIIDKDRYDERHRFWTEQALNQFGTASNFFFLISLGFIAFLFGKEQISDIFSFEGSGIDFSLLFFAFSILFAAVSLIASAITVLSRLYDLRLTRHIIWTRKRYYDKYSKLLSDAFIDLSGYNRWYQLRNFITTFRSESFIISDSDMENTEDFSLKFTNLRIRNLLLAKFSWWSMGVQILTLIISLCCFGISLMM